MHSSFYKIFREYEEIAVRYDDRHQAVWCYFNPAPRPCFSTVMLQNIRQVQEGIRDFYEFEPPSSNHPIRYFILCSQVPGVFNLGGDLALFQTLIKEKNRQHLLDYAILCIDAVYINAVSMHLPLTTLSLVEGAALGGGFETALSSNVLLATENAEMGFPEIRFNLFPGMGAYSLLARLSGMAVADRIITSGKIYKAKELHDIGLIERIVDAEHPRQSVEHFIRQHQRSGNGHNALQKVRHRYHTLEYEELFDIIRIWVDAALRLRDKDLRLMERLVKAQHAKVTPDKYDKKRLLRTKQDRRLAEKAVQFPLTDWQGETITTDRRIHSDRRRAALNHNQ